MRVGVGVARCFSRVVAVRLFSLVHYLSIFWKAFIYKLFYKVMVAICTFSKKTLFHSQGPTQLASFRLGPTQLGNSSNPYFSSPMRALAVLHPVKSVAVRRLHVDGCILKRGACTPASSLTHTHPTFLASPAPLHLPRCSAALACPATPENAGGCLSCPRTPHQPKLCRLTEVSWTGINCFFEFFRIPFRSEGLQLKEKPLLPLLSRQASLPSWKRIL